MHKLNELQLNLDVDARRHIEPHQRVDRLRIRILDIDQALVRTNLEVLVAILVNVRRAANGIAFDPGR